MGNLAAVDPDLILVAGDTHGNAYHTYYLFETALNKDAKALVQVGDFGYWEHAPGGAEYLEMCSDLAVQNDLPLYWIDGNHENHGWLRGRYGPGGPQYNPTPEGFWEIRPGVYYIPRGTRWSWNGHVLMGLGGAYSVDKRSRLKKTRKAVDDWMEEHGSKVPFDVVESFQRWFPGEELTDRDVERALSDRTPIDILFTHDKPYMSNPPVHFKTLHEVFPNQQRIQKVVNALHPKLLVHGHLHVRYDDEIRCGDDGRMTHVLGLSCDVDPNNPKQVAERNPEDSWVLLQLKPR